MTLVIGGATVKSTGYVAILVANDLSTNAGCCLDGISMFFYKASVVGGSSTYGELTFTLWDTTATAFSSTALPLTLDLADFGPNPDNRYGAVHEGSMQIIFNLDTLVAPGAPVALCKDVTVGADSGCQASASVDNGSYDPDGGPITLSQSPAGPYSLGSTSVTLTVTNSQGLSSQCTGNVTVVDYTPPQR